MVRITVAPHLVRWQVSSKINYGRQVANALEYLGPRLQVRVKEAIKEFCNNRFNKRAVRAAHIYLDFAGIKSAWDRSMLIRWALMDD